MWKRLPWLAPERMKHLSHVTVKSEVWAIGTTLWQMFSGARNPSAEIEDRLGKTGPTALSDCEVVQFFQDNKGFSCPKYLKPAPSEFYQAILPCWTIDSEDRPHPNVLLRSFIEICQSYGSNCHTYSSLDYSGVSVEQRESESSGGQKSLNSITQDMQRETRNVPDISALTDHDLKSESPNGKDTAEFEKEARVMELLEHETTNFHMTNTNRYNAVLNDETSLQIFWDENIGKGAFGDVFMGRLENKDVAIKKCRNASEYPRFKREFELLHKLDSKHHHPNIVEFIGLYALKDAIICYAYVMEYAVNQSLVRFLETQPVSVMVHQKLKFLKDAANGMQFLFENNIIHCDLTAENILVKADLTALISDFGWAKELDTDVEDYTYKRSNLKTKFLWSAPEVLHSKYSKFTDNWSYGVVCCEVFLDGKQPCFDDLAARNKDADDLYWRKILQGERFPCPETCPKEIYDSVVLRCWEKEFSKRIHFHDIVTHIGSWLKKHPT